jgi:acetyl-CoA synthetase
MTTDFVWLPAPADVERTHLARFMRLHGLADLAGLQARSTTDVSWFTNAIIAYLDIRFQQPYRAVLDVSGGVQFPQWCVGGQLNIVYNCVDKWLADAATADRAAIEWEGEDGRRASLTFRALAADVNRCANALRSLGLGKGDAIAIHLPMTPQIAIALLAIAKIGAVIVPLFSGFGAGAIRSRLQDAGARALFTADGAARRGRIVPLKSVADEALADLPALQHVIVLEHAGNPIAMKAGRDHLWSELLAAQPAVAAPEPTAAEDPLLIIYTSGTTGRPKGAVHTHCGFPVKVAQDMAFGTDVHAGDRICWLTDMGWMMGPWLVFGALLLGATCCLYDGAPDFPDAARLWQFAVHHRLTQLGVSPSLVRALRAHGNAPATGHDLSALRLFASTGEPWNPDPWYWLFEVVGRRRIPIINYSGGTEISGGILMGNPITPLVPCAFSGACPGIDAVVLDASGQAVRGTVGELAIRAPWIGMTRGFWRDRERYLETYWARWPNVWVHGDWALQAADGQWQIVGRSDDTINVAGKRIGPAEVESALVGEPAVVEAAAVGVPDEMKGSAVICFCVLAPGRKGDDALRSALKVRVAAELGKPLQPKAIHFVADLPKTRNAKVMRRIIRAAFLGDELGDTSALVNPECVAAIARMREL